MHGATPGKDQLSRYTSEAEKLRGLEKNKNKKTLEKSYSKRYEEAFIRRTQAVLSIQ
jgi:hypothetical protein